MPKYFARMRRNALRWVLKSFGGARIYRYIEPFICKYIVLFHIIIGIVTT